MKFTQYIKSATVVLTTAFNLVFVGCNQDSQIFSPETSNTGSRTSVQSAGGKTIHFLGFGEHSRNTLQKVTTTQQYIEKSQGGAISLSAEGNGLNVAFTLTVPPNSIDFSKTISMTFDDENYEGFTDLVFGPHGTQYATPALLDVDVSGLDLTGIDPANVKLYYVNDNGLWEEMVAASISVDLLTGNVVIDDAHLPHFSRYAIAAE